MGIDTGLATRAIQHNKQRNQQTCVDTINTTPGLPTVERETGIEPVSLAWKAKVLPLNYSRPGVFQVSHFSFNHEADASNFCSLHPLRDLCMSLPLVEEAGFEPA
jgi:hypothetical protein